MLWESAEAAVTRQCQNALAKIAQIFQLTFQQRGMCRSLSLEQNLFNPRYELYQAVLFMKNGAKYCVIECGFGVQGVLAGTEMSLCIDT